MIAILIAGFEGSASSDRSPAYAVEDAAPAPDARDWDSEAFAKVETETAGAPAEDNIEKEARGLEKAIFQNVGPLTTSDTEVPEVDQRQILWTFAKDDSRKFFPTASAARAGVAHGLSGPSADVVSEAALNVELKAEKKILPSRDLSRLSDEELRDLCADLRRATHLTIDTASGASIQNFTQKNPLLLKVGRVKRIENVSASFVAIVAGEGLSRVQSLKGIHRPHLVCNVGLSLVEGIESALIVVGPRLPLGLLGKPHVRFIETSAALMTE